MVPQKLVTIINDIVSHVRLGGLDSPGGGALAGEMIVVGQKRKNPLSRVFVRLHSYAVKLECGAQKKTRTSTALRPPAPEAGVSTNFTIWAVSAALPLLMGRTIRSAFESVKPCFDLDSINQTLRMQKPAFAGFWRSLKIQTICSSECGAQKKTRTSTALRPPAPEAGVSTNFTIWAVSITSPSSMARTIRTTF